MVVLVWIWVGEMEDVAGCRREILVALVVQKVAFDEAEMKVMTVQTPGYGHYPQVPPVLPSLA